MDVTLVAVAVAVVLVLAVVLQSIHRIGAAEVGLVNKKLGFKKLHDDNPIAFHGEAGYQAELLMPGLRFRLWPVSTVSRFPWVQVPAGETGVVIAQVGFRLGPKYTVTCTVPGITPAPGQASGQIRQYLYPHAAGGPVICTPPEQQGSGQPLQATGWLRGTPQLTATLTRLGAPAGTSLPSAPSPAISVPAAPAPAAAPEPGDTTAPAWLIATITSAVTITIAGTVLWLRRRPGPPLTGP